MTEFYPDWQNKRDDLPENFNELPEGDRAQLMQERVRLLHIYGQPWPHSEVRIIGNKNALIVLRDALTAIIDQPEERDGKKLYGHGETSVMTNDGEGYSVSIERNNTNWTSPYWENLRAPYTEPPYGGRQDLDHHITLYQMALAKANGRLVKRGVKPVPDPIENGINIRDND